VYRVRTEGAAFRALLWLFLAGVSTCPAELRPDPGDPKYPWYRLESTTDPDMREFPDTTLGAWNATGQLRWSDEGHGLAAHGVVRFGGGLALGLQVIGGDRAEDPARLGTTKRWRSWTGRVTDNWLRWSSNNLLLEFGRGPIGLERDRISELVVSRELPTADQLAYVLSTDSGNLQLRVSTARLRSERDPGQFNRWLALHRLTWRPGSGRTRVSIGDCVLYTGRHRAMELRYLNPLVPFFTASFDGFAIRDEERVTGDGEYKPDNDNNMLFLDWDWWFLQDQPWRSWNFRQYGELVLDEFQADAEDRRRIDDILGCTLGAEARFRFSGRTLGRLRAEGGLLSQWLYLHPGEETSWLDRGRYIGNREGGDLGELHFEAELFSRIMILPRLRTRFTHLLLGLDWFRKGEIGPDWERDFDVSPGGLGQYGVTERTLRWRAAGDLETAVGRTGLLMIRAEARLDWIDNWEHDPGERRRIGAISIEAVLQGKFGES